MLFGVIFSKRKSKSTPKRIAYAFIAGSIDCNAEVGCLKTKAEGNPHRGQNLFASGFSNPHFEQMMISAGEGFSGASTRKPFGRNSRLDAVNQSRDHGDLYDYSLDNRFRINDRTQYHDPQVYG